MNPDPYNAGANPSNPQTWNMYSYVMDNPLRFVDPTGMDCTATQAQATDPECGGGSSANSGDSLPSSPSQLPPFTGKWIDVNVWHKMPYTPMPYTPTGCQFDFTCSVQYGKWFGNSGPPFVREKQPQSPLHPPTQQQYNACMQQAASTRNSAILNGRAEQAVGGLLTLIGVGTAAYSLPALGEGFFNEGAAGLVDFAHAGGFAYFGALGPLGAGVGVFGKGSYDVANAWNQYYANTISCAASHP